jgi:hypothetical protein
MALDFTTASLDPRVTVTRALNTATVINSSGLIATVNADLPRFDYDPSTLACKGLLIEESRINRILYSEDFSNANWAKTGVTVSANATVAPDGNTTADALVEDGATGLHITQQFFTFATATAYTISLFIKPSLRTWVQVFLPTAAFGAAQGGYFNLSGAGSLGNVTGAPTSRTITAFPNGWYRITITATSTASAGGNIGIAAASANGTTSYAGSNGSTALSLWGADLEIGAFATSYIANLATGTTTRNTDVVSMTGTNFSDWYNASEGAFLAEYSSYAATASGFSKSVISVNDTTLSNRLYVNINASAVPFLFINSSNSAQANMNTGVTLTNETTTKTAFAYKVDSFVAATNGATVVTDNLGTVPTTTALNIGHQVNFSSLFGHMKKLSYWPQRLINNETQSFSK